MRVALGVVVGLRQRFPLSPCDSGLSKQIVQQFFADVALMGIGNTYTEISTPHHFMSARRKWTIEA